jgi:hypothetical protein
MPTWRSCATTCKLINLQAQQNLLKIQRESTTLKTALALQLLQFIGTTTYAYVTHTLERPVSLHAQLSAKHPR